MGVFRQGGRLKHHHALDYDCWSDWCAIDQDAQGWRWFDWLALRASCWVSKNNTVEAQCFSHALLLPDDFKSITRLHDPFHCYV